LEQNSDLLIYSLTMNFLYKNLLLTASLILLLSIFSSAQTKILFDATKAESAGSADWVIDADQHNLSWSNGPAVLNGGSESNPQQLPNPAQSGVATSTSETYWLGGISAWGIDLVKKGYTVETLPYNGTISYNNSSNAQDLKNYKVFIVVEPNILFTTAEKTAILQFVQNGGGLFMVSDHTGADRNNDGVDSPQVWNDLMDTNSVHPFGIHFDHVDISQTSNNVASIPTDTLLHGPIGNVTEVMWSGGTTMTLSTSNNATVKGIVYKTGSSNTGTNNVMVARSKYGAGRVVGIGDSSPCDDGTGDPNDVLYYGWTGDANGNHEKLVVNATIWLASGGAITDIETVDLANSIKFYPDPFTTSAQLVIDGNIPAKNGELKILDINGRMIRRIESEDMHLISIERNGMQNGMYFYQFYSDNSLVAKGRFVVTK
jgi:hypothetical protein